MEECMFGQFVGAAQRLSISITTRTLALTESPWPRDRSQLSSSVESSIAEDGRRVRPEPVAISIVKGIDKATKIKPTAESCALKPFEVPVCDLFPQPSQTGPTRAALNRHHSIRKKATAKFTPSDCCSSSELSESDLVPPSGPYIFQMDGFSGPASTDNSMHCDKFNSKKSKQAIRFTSRSRQAELEASKAIHLDTGEDCVDESAIDDEDASEWEDYTEEIGKTNVDEKFFRRIEFKANLAVCKPSLVSLVHAERWNESSYQTSRPASASLSSCLEPSLPTQDASFGPYLKKSEDINTSSCDQHWYTCAFDRYHTTGW
ncbi:uncharacterized protein LMH87_007683 [Akanthomyces muscarius]|uniref:DUF3295 domain-containing protein n=1 Tax=Akanthomyces muscarius TaxID=2231603 RepID=A0A9W8QKP6_AKAMU|nr:uncharacterized protein LMH87_007683 [Akanthomyces muscarius]KAJ4161656.1 hypothetical protein LMH87_007683 [Akanthomyces muscarius]